MPGYVYILASRRYGTLYIGVTNDIARGLTTSLAHAERLKTLYGNATPSSMDEREIIDVPLVGEEASERLKHFASTTREASEHNGRITSLIASGKFFNSLGIASFNAEHDRIMMCGSMGMIKDIREMLEPLGFTEGSNNQPGNFVVERAFVG